ncbi:MAG: hypothetical protein CM1200mP5_0980 [Candidatus Pelagibacterales bacterium]|nr:MAG: hypothetical protein CM1200mP5_0980 [Pelagibacterales bacterium]
MLDKSIHYYKLCWTKPQKEKVFLNNLANIYYKQMDYLNAIQIYEQSYSINNNQEEVVEKLASSLVELD